jgi:predicted phage tail protein
VFGVQLSAFDEKCGAFWVVAAVSVGIAVDAVPFFGVVGAFICSMGVSALSAGVVDCLTVPGKVAPSLAADASERVFFVLAGV